jgi:hypothetical protein
MPDPIPDRPPLPKGMDCLCDQPLRCRPMLPKKGPRTRRHFHEEPWYATDVPFVMPALGNPRSVRIPRGLVWGHTAPCPRLDTVSFRHPSTRGPPAGKGALPPCIPHQGYPLDPGNLGERAAFGRLAFLRVRHREFSGCSNDRRTTSFLQASARHMPPPAPAVNVPPIQYDRLRTHFIARETCRTPRTIHSGTLPCRPPATTSAPSTGD